MRAVTFEAGAGFGRGVPELRLGKERFVAELAQLRYLRHQFLGEGRLVAGTALAVGIGLVHDKNGAALT